MRSGFVNKTRAEAKKEKVSERLRYLQAQLTDQYQISYNEALEKAHELGKSHSGRARG